MQAFSLSRRRRLAFFAGAIIITNKTRKIKKDYANQFKHLVVGPFFSKLLELSKLPNETEAHENYCYYKPEERISDELIQQSELFETKIDVITGEDLFQGKYGVTEFEMSELNMIANETSTDAEGYESKTKTTIFKGVLFAADFNKDFSGLTVIERNLFTSDRGISKLAGKVLNGKLSYASKRAKKIKLEHTEFNRLFSVHTTDEMEARSLLTSSLMEKLIAFSTNHNHYFTISLNHSTIFVAFSSNKNHFDEGIGKHKGHYDLKGIYNDLVFFLSMIEEFDLNTTNWSKVH